MRARKLAPEADTARWLWARTSARCGPATPKIQACSPKAIQQEVRCWVIEGRVVTASVHRMGQRVLYSDVVDRRFVDFAEELSRQWSPLKAYCLDVCDTENGLRL